MRDDTDDYRQVLLSGVPLMDVRAPVEFAKGAFPHAHNLPLMDDDERHRVGLCYKQQGQDAAIALGHRIVSGDLKAARLAAWTAFAQQHPEGYLYCFRGGLRSRTVQQWLRDEAGVHYPLVRGGYKALRQFAVGTIDHHSQHSNWWVLGGMTGTGKTEVVTQFAQGVDLEGLAHHRGSSFGWRARPQPTPIDFENALAIALLRGEQSEAAPPWLVEDESRCIGQCALPVALYQRMQRSPVVWLEEAFDARVDRILWQYVTSQCQEHVALHGPDEGFVRFSAGLLQSMHNIRKRLGLERHAKLQAALQAALDAHARHGDTALHRVWIEGLLRDYYDPMYAYQQQSKAERIVFRGPRDEVVAYLQAQLARAPSAPPPTPTLA